jgi:hypothetical protein
MTLNHSHTKRTLLADDSSTSQMTARVLLAENCSYVIAAIKTHLGE